VNAGEAGIRPPEGLDATPRLVIDRRRMDANIDAMAGAMRSIGRRLRPHFKTSKLLEVSRLQRAAGAVGFCCATVAELDALLGDGVRDLLWAHQPVGPAKVAAAVDRNRVGRVVVALDSLDAARPLAAAATAAGVVVPFAIEVDSGLGRAGVAPAEAPGLAGALDALDGISCVGVFTHEGHLMSIRDDRGRLEEAGRATGAVVSEVAAAMAAHGLGTELVSVGSTPGANSAPLAEGITEARPGTYVFFDANQVALGSATWDDCALTVVARVVSRPRPEVAIVDAGIKALSSDASVAGNGFGVPAIAEARFDSAYEEHGRLTGPGADRLAVGDLVSIVPNHACGAVNMWSSVLVADDGTIVDDWTTVARH